MNFLKSISWQLCLVVVLLLGTIVIIVLINTLSKRNKLLDTTATLVNPVNIPEKQNCKSVRTPCDPKDPKSCADACTEEELKCVILDSITPTAEGKAINRGGAVCLPDYPTIECVSDNGGVYVWTGYGFTDNQTWDCYCMYPEFFGGPGCKNQNPDLCSGGQVDVSKLNGSEPTSDICVCPVGTTLMLRGGTNTPYCESTDPSKGGGMFGMAGSLHSSPDWRNVLYRQVSAASGGGIAPEPITVWAGNITRELTSSYDPTKDTTKNLISNVTSLLSAADASCVNCAYTDQTCSSRCTSHALGNLDQGLADQICSTICPNSCDGICDCGTGKAVWNQQIGTTGNKMWYTYDPNDIPPQHYCTQSPMQFYCADNCAGDIECPPGTTCYASQSDCVKACAPNPSKA